MDLHQLYNTLKITGFLITAIGLLVTIIAFLVKNKIDDPEYIANKKLNTFIKEVERDSEKAMAYFPTIFTTPIPEKKYNEIAKITLNLSNEIKSSEYFLRRLLIEYLVQELPYKFGTDKRFTEDIMMHLDYNIIPKSSYKQLLQGRYSIYLESKETIDLLAYLRIFDADLINNYKIMQLQFKNEVEKREFRNFILDIYQIKTKNDILPIVTNSKEKKDFFHGLLEMNKK